MQLGNFISIKFLCGLRSQGHCAHNRIRTTLPPNEPMHRPDGHSNSRSEIGWHGNALRGTRDTARTSGLELRYHRMSPCTIRTGTRTRGARSGGTTNTRNSPPRYGDSDKLERDRSCTFYWWTESIFPPIQRKARSREIPRPCTSPSYPCPTDPCRHAAQHCVLLRG